MTAKQRTALPPKRLPSTRLVLADCCFVCLVVVEVDKEDDVAEVLTLSLILSFALNDVDEVDDEETNEEVVEKEEVEEEELFLLLACLVTELCCICWAWADDTEVDIDEVSNSIFCVTSSARTLLDRSDSGLLLEDSFFA